MFKKFILGLLLISLNGYTQQIIIPLSSYNTLSLADPSETSRTGMTDYPFLNQEIATNGKKSVGKAFLMSLIIPGAGEYYAGETSFTKFFLGMEVLGWGALLLNVNLYSSLRNDFKNYAVLHAGVQDRKNADKYWGDIGKFDDIFSYNIQRKRDRALNEVYTENTANYWSWDSKENRVYYDRKRLDASEIKDREIFFITGLLLNHLVSAINAVRLARRYNKNLAYQTMDYRFVLNLQNPYNGYIGLSLSKSF